MQQDSTLAETLRQTEIPAASIAIIRKDEVTTQFAGVLGDIPFEAASLTKPFFAYLVLKMVEQELFSRPGESAASGLDRPLTEITTEFGPLQLRKHPYQKMLTVRRILSHQAGLPNWLPLDYKSKPAVGFDYSGMAFCFLNDVVEFTLKKTGKNLDLLAKDTFEQLGMTHSSMIEPRRYAPGHFSDGKPDNRKHFFRSNPAASLFTTAKDYAKFLQACLDDKFIRQHIFQQQIKLLDKDHKAQQAQTTKTALNQIYWGLGFGLQITHDGKMIAFHWGDSESYRAFTAINLQSSRAVVCFTNSGNGPRIFKIICEPIVGDLSPVWQWLSRRENLDLQPPLALTPFLQKNLCLFKKFEKSFLTEHRHDDSKLLRAYNTRFGLMLSPQSS